MARRQVNRAAKAQPIERPAPLQGWNARDGLVGMDPSFATTLINLVPTVGKLALRKGSDDYATGVGAGAVETLFEYIGSGARKFLAAGGGSIYNISASGAAVSLGSGFANNRWQAINFNNNALLVNGADTPRTFNGTALAASTITGPTVTNLIGAAVHKNRVYVWESASQSVWYGDTNAIGGAFLEFPLSRISTLGGYVVGCSTWTQDGGDGVDDLFVAAMSSGAMIVYQGSDPGDINNWSQIGVFHDAQPVNVRAIVKEGGDLWITTRADHDTMTRLFRRSHGGDASSDDVMNRSLVTGAVQSRATSTAIALFGWQAVHWPEGGLLIFNVPLTASTFEQHVLNTTTDRWCKFTGLLSYCWGTFNGDLYYGSSGGKVYKYTGTDDLGAAISVDCQGAWDDLGTPGRKRLAAVRALVGISGDGTYEFGLGYDFRDNIVTAPTTITGSGTPWGSPWGSPWTAELQIDSTWRVAGGSGTHVAYRLRFSTLQDIAFHRVDYRLEPGSAL